MVTEHPVSTEGPRQVAQVIEAGADPAGGPAAVDDGDVWRRQRYSAAGVDLMRFTGWPRSWCGSGCTPDRRRRARPGPIWPIELATGLDFGYVDGALVRAEAWRVRAGDLVYKARPRPGDGRRRHSRRRERDGHRASVRLRCDVNRRHIGFWPGVDEVPTGGDAQGRSGSVIADVAAPARQPSAPGGAVGGGGLVSCREPFAGEAPVELPAAGVRFVRRSRRGTDRLLRDVSAGRACAAGGGAHQAGRRPTQYREVAVAALASADTEHAASFVTRVLGPLAAPTRTPCGWRPRWRSICRRNPQPARTAKRLIVHPNTVSYRQPGRADPGRSIDTDVLELSGGAGAATDTAGAGGTSTARP